jgi:hypothetical protein
MKNMQRTPLVLSMPGLSFAVDATKDEESCDAHGRTCPSDRPMTVQGNHGRAWNR